MEAGRVIEGAARRIEALLDASSQREVAATTIAVIAIGGALFGFATYALPHPDGTNFVAPSVAFAVAIAYGVIVLARRRAGWATIALGVALGSVVITVAMLSVPDRTSAYVTFYVWLAVFAFYFLRPGWALLQTAWIAALYAVAVVVDDPPGAIELWANGVVTMLGLGLLVLAFRARIAGLITRLERSARTNDLTALPNRRAFVEQLDRELAAARRSGAELSLVLLDLDNFKQLNDLAGHPAGDAGLRVVAEVIRAQTRPGDWPARIGGDEFVVILPGSSESDAARVAQRICERIAARFPDGAVRLRASAGAAASGSPAHDAGRLLRDADRALYAAKRAGGDRAAALTTITALDEVEEPMLRSG